MTTSHNIDQALMINRITFAESNEFVFQSNSGNWDLSNVTKFNFFIGANNSGKSRILRYVFRSKMSSGYLDSDECSVQELLDELNQFDYDSISYSKFNRKLLSSSIAKSLSDVRFESLKEQFKKSLKQFQEKQLAIDINTLREELIQDVIRKLGIRDIRDLCDKLYDEITACNQDKINTLTQYFSAFTDRNRIYIPTLRSLRHISGQDDYLMRTNKDYFEKSDTFINNIFTGYSIYQDLKTQLLGTHEQRAKVRKFETFLSDSFFYGEPITLTPRINEDVIYFKEGEKEERPIYDLGDGIQAIIILTYPVFMAEKPTIFFIEEPEKYLHAGLQRTLIEAFNAIPDHMFFMTTHSNHFLDLQLERNDVSIHQVMQKENQILTKSSAELTDILNNLGVRASSVLLANCSIWVEGVTDKLYLKAYMKKYLYDLEKDEEHVERLKKLKSFHENLHYVFIEYQGSNVTHWNFDSEEVNDDKQTQARVVNNNILLIADGDIDSKGNRVESLENALGKKFHLLERKEIENYIPIKVMKETATARWKTFNKKDSCEFDIELLKQDDYVDKGIGKVLESYVTGQGERSFFNGSGQGTIKDKVKFCQEAINYMNNHMDDWTLTDELKTLCELIWKHVEESNY